MIIKTIISLILLNVTIIESKVRSQSTSGHNEDQRKCYQTKDELSLTKLEPIFEAEPCGDHQPLSIFIPSTATTDGVSYLKRQTQRKTLVSEAKENNISVYFMIALSENQTTNELLKEESNRYKDMIQMQFIDNYWNLTLKSVSILRWAQNKCNNSKLIIKTDDDTVLNINNLLNSWDQFKSGITGSLLSYSFLELECQASRYNKVNHMKKINMPYALGPIYAITTDVIPKLLSTLETYSGRILDQEDLFVTGVLAKEAGVPLFEGLRIIYRGLPFKCGIHNQIALTCCISGEDLVRNYENWKNSQSCVRVPGYSKSIAHSSLISSSMKF